MEIVRDKRCYIDFFGTLNSVHNFIVLWFCEFKTLVELLLRYSGPISLKNNKQHDSTRAVFLCLKNIILINRIHDILIQNKLNICAICNFLLAAVLIQQYQDDIIGTNRRKHVGYGREIFWVRFYYFVMWMTCTAVLIVCSFSMPVIVPSSIRILLKLISSSAKTLIAVINGL